MDDKKSIQPPSRATDLAPKDIRPDNILKVALQTLTPEKRQELLGEAAKEALSLEVEKQKIELLHSQTERHIENHLSTVQGLGSGNFVTRHKVQTDFATGAGRMKIESRSGFGCFIMSAIYDDANHPDVLYLKKIRDDRLIKYSMGRRFVNWYYYNGSKMALWLDGHHAIKRAIKLPCKLCVQFLKLMTGDL